MKQRAVNIMLLLILVTLDIVFIARVRDIASIYPFDRIMIGNELVYNIDFLDQSPHYRYRVVRLNGSDTDSRSAIDIIKSIRNTHFYSVVFEHGGVHYSENLIHPGFNKKLAWFFIILLLFANIHFLYGLFIRIFRSNSYQARLFIFTSLGLSLFYFCLIDLFSFNDFKLLFVLVIVILGYITMLVGYNLSRESLSRNAVVLFCLLTIILFCFIADYSGRPFDSLAMKAIFIYLLSFGIISIWKLLVNIFRERNSYVIKRESMIIAGIVFAYLVPLLMYGIWLYTDIPPFLHFLTGLTLIIPLVIGNSIFQYNLFSFRLFFARGFILFAKNIAIAVTGASLIFYTSWQEKSLSELSLLYVGFLLLFGYVLYLGRTVTRRVSNVIYVNRNRYTRSLQKIENLTSSPEDMNFKILHIFEELQSLMNIAHVRLVLFDSGYDLSRPETGDTIELITDREELKTFFQRNTGTTIRFFLLKKSPEQEMVFNFMEERGAILASPIFRDSRITGVLLTGEKLSGDQFNGIDINYIDTVALLITQHLENDRLFKDYIINRRFEMELDIASYIQMRLFPKKAPPKSKLLISFYNRPFLKVTGDYFDFIELDKHNTALIIGDVSGHGLGAAMILTMTNSIMHGMLRENKPIESAIEEINHFLNYSYQGTELITLFAGIYNNITRELTYINAGHCAPVHITKNRKSFYPLEGRSKIIGADPHANYFPSKLTLAKDDELLFYTDGIIEIYDEKTDHEFNEKSLYDIIAKNLDADIERKIHEIVEHISKFNHTIKDDITIIAVKIT